jgi:AraC family transcriptional regulator of adaptative response/methylated-DNA-[protein]-cysteine methyltransferase
LFPQYEKESGSSDTQPKLAPRLDLHLLGTRFQLTVWEALLRIPSGQLVSYERLAGLCDCPAAVRAVASGVGANPVSWLVPCHRVIRKMGLVGQYRWGSLVKGSLIAWEASRGEAVEQGR